MARPISVQDEGKLSTTHTANGWLYVFKTGPLKNKKIYSRKLSLYRASSIGKVAIRGTDGYHINLYTEEEV